MRKRVSDNLIDNFLSSFFDKVVLTLIDLYDLKEFGIIIINNVEIK